MPLWAIQLILTVLVKSGFPGIAATLAAKGIVIAKNHLENLKTYAEYPKE